MASHADIHVLQDLLQAVISADTQRRLGMLHHSYPLARIHLVGSQFNTPSDQQKSADLAKSMA